LGIEKNYYLKKRAGIQIFPVALSISRRVYCLML